MGQGMSKRNVKYKREGVAGFPISWFKVEKQLQNYF